MKSRGILFLVLLLLQSTLVLAQNGISKAEISFTFVSKDVDGSISGFSSSSSIDLDNIATSKFNGSVRVETIKTGNFLRDWSLKGKKYFDADTHPNIRFESTSIETTDTGFNVMGQLTIKGKSKPIRIDFVQTGNQLKGTTTLFSSDFGINIKKGREDNEVIVNFLLTL
ncbi:YceI family protein [Ulvibacterium sp.]|uniref:YceI family protein n=1 Tax=Ulvibacterium sp. TaxID=2665914 RepID=UPI00260B7B71|nr:YceI family protein [Ulvibacterium sp.]